MSGMLVDFCGFLGGPLRVGLLYTYVNNAIALIPAFNAKVAANILFNRRGVTKHIDRFVQSTTLLEVC